MRRALETSGTGAEGLELFGLIITSDDHASFSLDLINVSLQALFHALDGRFQRSLFFDF